MFKTSFFIVEYVYWRLSIWVIRLALTRRIYCWHLSQLCSIVGWLVFFQRGKYVIDTFSWIWMFRRAFTSAMWFLLCQMRIVIWSPKIIYIKVSSLLKNSNPRGWVIMHLGSCLLMIKYVARNCWRREYVFISYCCLRRKYIGLRILCSI